MRLSDFKKVKLNKRQRKSLEKTIKIMCELRAEFKKK